jgi:hypothetical protein
MEMASYLKGATGLMAAQESEAAKLARKNHSTPTSHILTPSLMVTRNDAMK